MLLGVLISLAIMLGGACIVAWNARTWPALGAGLLILTAMSSLYTVVVASDLISRQGPAFLIYGAIFGVAKWVFWIAVAKCLLRATTGHWWPQGPVPLEVERMRAEER